MAIRNEDIVFRTSVEGDQAIDRLDKEIQELSGTNKELEASSAAVLAKMTELNNTLRKTEAFRELKTQTDSLKDALEKAQAQSQKLGKELAATTEPTRKQTTEFEKAAGQTRKLAVELDNTEKQTQKLRTELAAAGISTARLATDQQNLKNQLNQSKSVLIDNADQLRRIAAEHKKTGDAAKDSQEKIQTSVRESNKTFGFLSRTLATITAYVGFDRLITKLKELFGVAAEFEVFRKRLESTFESAAKGEEAFAWVKQFAKQTPITLKQTLDTFIKLKNAGIDPTTGALQAIVDQVAKVGGGQEKLERITRALTQSYQKQRLQLEELNQLAENGVPVFAILEKQLGKTTAEILKLTAKGELGIESVKKLIQGIGENAAGAATAQMKTLNGLISNAKDNIDLFYDRIANSGALQTLKDQIQRVNDKFNELSANGKLQEYAKGISDAISGSINAVVRAAGFIVEYGASIAQLGKAYLAFKAIDILSGLTNVALGFVRAGNASLEAANKANQGATSFRALGVAMRAIPANVLITVGLLGIDAAIKAAKSVGESFAESSEVNQRVIASQAKIREELVKTANTYGQLSASLAQYKDTQILTATQVAELSSQEALTYKTRLAGLLQYLTAKRSETTFLLEAGQATRQDYELTQDAVNKAKEGLIAYEAGIRTAAEAIAADLSPAAFQLTKDLAGVAESSDRATLLLTNLFKGLDLATTSVTKIGDIALALTSIATQSDKANANVKAGLKATLSEMSGLELLKFQSASIAAFNTFGTSAKQAEVVLKSTLDAALSKLNVSAISVGAKFTESAIEAQAAFTTIAENATATALEIEVAFRAALSSLTSVEDVRILGSELQQAFDAGRISADQLARATNDLNQRIRSLEEAINPLADAFSELGIKSQQELDNAALSAKENFDTIVRGAKAGEASIEDVRRAFVAYAKAQLDSVANSSQFEQSQVKSMLSAKAASLGLKDALVELGLAGTDAGDKIVEGANRASESLTGVTQKASEASGALGGAGQTASDAASGFNSAAQATENLNSSTSATGQQLGAVSEDFAKAAAGASGYATAIDSLIGQLNEQREQAGERVARLERELSLYDPLSRKVAELRNQYRFLDNQTLRGIAERELRLEQARQESEKQNQEANKITISSSSGTRDLESLEKQKKLKEEIAKLDNQPDLNTRENRTQSSSSDLVVRFVNDSVGQAVKLTESDLQRITEEIVRRLNISRGNS
jgi:tape measure domain-containing protein